MTICKAENAYFEAAMEPHAELVETLFEEMKGRLKEDESSVPIRDGDWLYWWAFKPGAQYRYWYRRKFAGGPDEMLFDEPAEAEGKDYFRLGALEVSPDGELAAVLVDDNGSERFQLRIRDIASGHDIETVTDVGIGQPVWSSDSQGVVFTEVNENWRSYRARYHRLGRPVGEDVTLYEETEELGFSVGVVAVAGPVADLHFDRRQCDQRSALRSRRRPAAPLTLISPRQEKREYSVDAAHGRLWILTNDDHVNFRLAEADPAAPEVWKTVIAGSDRVYLRGVTSYRDHLAISQRVDGLDQLVLRKYSGEEARIPFGEASYSAGFGGNPEFAPDAYRLIYSSMVTPLTVYDYHPQTGELETLKVQEIPSGYDPSLYRTERLMVPARDGKQVPVSVVYPKGFAEERRGQALPLRLRRLRHGDPAELRHRPDQPARPRLGLCHRPHPRRRRFGLRLVPAGQA